MAKKTNAKLIGAFVVGATALAVIGAIAFGGTAFLKHKNKSVVFFEDSVGGLNVGAPVLFRGVKIGEVTNIFIQYDEKTKKIYIPVYVETDPAEIRSMVADASGRRANLKRMIEQGLRAQLITQSLVTGQANIELDFHPETPIHLVGLEPDVFEMPTVPSTMAQLETSVSDILKKINKLPLDQLTKQIIDTVNTADDTLKEIKGVVISTGKQIPPLSESFIGAADKAQAALAEAKLRLELRDGEPLQNLNVALVDGRKLIGTADSRISQIVAEGVKTLEIANTALNQATQTLQTAQGAISPDSPLYIELNATLRELQDAATSIRIFADTIQRDPNALLTGK